MLLIIAAEFLNKMNEKNSTVNGPNLTKFINNVETSLPFYILKSELRYPNPFWNVRVTNESE